MATYSRYYTHSHQPTAHDGRSYITAIAISLVAITLAMVGYLIYVAYMGYEQGHKSPEMMVQDSTITPTESSLSHRPIFINTHFTR